MKPHAVPLSCVSGHVPPYRGSVSSNLLVPSGMVQSSQLSMWYSCPHVSCPLVLSRKQLHWGEPERAPHIQVVQRARLYMYRLYNEDEGLSNIHDRGRSPRTCLFDDPESELYNRLVPECGGVSVSYWFIQSCPM